MALDKYVMQTIGADSSSGALRERGCCLNTGVRYMSFNQHADTSADAIMTHQWLLLERNSRAEARAFE